MTDEKVCFFITPIGEQDSDIRKRADLVLKFIVRPIVEKHGYKAIRADEIDKPGMITSQLIQHIVNDPLVIADLTDRNPNVFYELAIRHAIRKPLVQMIRKGELLPFDVAGTRTIPYDHTDLESVESVKIEISKQIEALDEDPSGVETPISMSLDLQLLRQSDKPEDRSLADLLAGMADLRTQLGNLAVKTETADQNGVLDDVMREIQSMSRYLQDQGDLMINPFVRHGRFNAIMLRNLVRTGPRQSSSAALMIVASVFRDWIPWIYEMGLETARLARQGSSSEFLNAYREFRHQLDYVLHGPLSHEFLGNNRELRYLMDEIEPILDQAHYMADTERRMKGQDTGDGVIDTGKGAENGET